MSAPAKFLFDQDFAATAEVKPSIPLALHEASLLDADSSGYQRGFAAARAQILAEAEQRTAVAMERVATTLEGVVRGLSGVEAKLETEAVDVVCDFYSGRERAAGIAILCGTSHGSGECDRRGFESGYVHASVCIEEAPCTGAG